MNENNRPQDQPDHVAAEQVDDALRLAVEHAHETLRRLLYHRDGEFFINVNRIGAEALHVSTIATIAHASLAAHRGAQDPDGWVSSFESGSPLMCGLDDWQRKGLTPVFMTPQPSPVAQGDALSSTIMRFNLIGNLMNPAPNGLYVRHEDHAAAMAQQAQIARAACVPPGCALVPMRLTRAMNEVLAEEGWQWEDLLRAGEAISEADHAAISRNQPSDAEITESFLVHGVQAGPAHVDAVREILGNTPPATASGTAPVGLENCPITGMKFCRYIDHPERGLVPTYGGPFDAYTIPTLGDDGELRTERYSLESGKWGQGGVRLVLQRGQTA